MVIDDADRERAKAILGELEELGLMLARDLAVQARSAEETEEKVLLTAAFQKTSRTVRLTMALKFKLARDAARDAAEAARTEKAEAADVALRESRILQAARDAHVSMTDPSPIEIQKRRVTATLNRLIWNEAEGDQEDYEVLLEDLDARLYEAENAPGFADLPIDVLAKALKSDMRLTGELIITTAERFAAACTPHLPREAAGGGPSAPRARPKVDPRTGSEPMVEGASPKLSRSTGPP